MKQFAPAKINLYLHILGRRPDGFHELETLMVPISLGDTLDLDFIPSGIEFTCTDATLSDAADNLATKAARLFPEEFSLTAGFRIHLEKQVPVGAGLGGGSSDAARRAAGPAPTHRHRPLRREIGRTRSSPRKQKRRTNKIPHLTMRAPELKRESEKSRSITILATSGFLLR